MAKSIRAKFSMCRKAIEVLLSSALVVPTFAAPNEVAPVVGYANWWHVDGIFPDAQSFCEAMLAASGPGHPLHPAPAGCIDTGMYYRRLSAASTSVTAEFPLAGLPISEWTARCKLTDLPGPEPSACPLTLEIYVRREAYCPVGYEIVGQEASSNPTTEYWHGLETDFWRAHQYSGKIFISQVGVGGNPKCIALTPNQFDEDKNSAPNACGSGGVVGNPLHAGIGRKKQIEVDYRDPLGLLTFERQYWSGQSFGEALANNLLNPGRKANYVARWRHSFSASVQSSMSAAISTAWAVRPDNRTLAFTYSSPQWIAELDVNERLTEEKNNGGARLGWKLNTGTVNRIETYDASGLHAQRYDITGTYVQLIYSTSATPVSTAPWPGLLIAVIDSRGRQLNFRHDANGRMVKMIDPAGGEYLYAYDEASSVILSGQLKGNNLTSVTYPDGTKRIYHYNEPAHTLNTNLPNALTGISEESASGQRLRFATYKYDAQGRAVSTEHAGGVERYGVAYPTTSQSIVTDPQGAQRTYGFTTVLGVVKQSSLNQPAGAGCGPASSAITYDTQANVSSRTDFNAIKTCYAYDLSRNLETQRLEGLPSASVCAAVFTNPPADARLVTTQWHPDWRLETRRAEPRLITTWVYNGQGASCAPANALVDGKPIAVVCRRTEQTTSDDTGAQGFAASVSGPARTSTFTYNRWGQVLTRNGPRGDASDTVTYEYYPDTQANWTMGDLRQTTNAAGHVTRFTRYNRHGQMLERIEPNGLVTQYAYDLRQRLTRVQVGDEVSTYEYDPVGNLTRVSLPEGGNLIYTYDPAHRLVAIQDQQGNRIDYTLDAMGNRIGEKTTDAAGVLRRNLTRTIDALNRVQRVVGGE